MQKGMSALPPIATAKAISAAGHVRFTPESGHVRCTSPCLLWANSGHSNFKRADQLVEKQVGEPCPLQRDGVNGSRFAAIKQSKKTEVNTAQHRETSAMVLSQTPVAHQVMWRRIKPYQLCTNLGV